MTYYNYHAKAKQLIAEGHLTDYQVVPKRNLKKTSSLFYTTCIIFNMIVHNHHSHTSCYL